MSQAIERDPIYRGRRFQTETIELCVRWYTTYRLNYRDLAGIDPATLKRKLGAALEYRPQRQVTR
jgi:hypothetical protein